MMPGGASCRAARAAAGSIRGDSSPRRMACGPKTMASTTATDSSTLAASARGARYCDLTGVRSAAVHAAACAVRAACSTRTSRVRGGAGAGRR